MAALTPYSPSYLFDDRELASELNDKRSFKHLNDKKGEGFV